MIWFYIYKPKKTTLKLLKKEILPNSASHLSGSKSTWSVWIGPIQHLVYTFYKVLEIQIVRSTLHFVSWTSNRFDISLKWRSLLQVIYGATPNFRNFNLRLISSPWVWKGLTCWLPKIVKPGIFFTIDQG